jgi:sulfonate transport system ATP-binding protein
MSHPSLTGSVQLHGFSRSFHGKQVLDDVHLDIAPGQFVALLGESGSGKTTLLRALAGLDAEARSSGRRWPMAMSPCCSRTRACCLADGAGQPDAGAGRAGGPAAAVQLLREVGLEDKAAAWPATLSGGQKQRAALARSCCASRMCCWPTSLLAPWMR